MYHEESNVNIGIKHQYTSNANTKTETTGIFSFIFNK